MKRREFMTLVGGAAAWPLAARAQQPPMPVIGLLTTGRALSDRIQTAFREGLKDFGYVEGQNVSIEYRFAEDQLDRLPALAADLVQRRVAVIAAGVRCGEAAKAATSAIPIVFLSGSDPVRTGLVTRLNRPGGNLTGVSLLSPDVETKRLGILRELIPRAASVAALIDSTSALLDHQVQQVQAAAQSLGMSLRLVTVGGAQDLDAAVATVAREGAGALIVTSSVLFLSTRHRLAALAAHHELPAIFELREYAEAGGLLSYGPTLKEAWRQMGIYTGRILKGEKPGDLPVVQSIKFELIINLKSAKALRLEVPDKLLALADEVIE